MVLDGLDAFATTRDPHNVRSLAPMEQKFAFIHAWKYFMLIRLVIHKKQFICHFLLSR